MSARTRLTLIRLGWQQFAVLVAGILLIPLVILIVFLPNLVELYVERVSMKRLEAAFQFSLGELRSDVPVVSGTIWGVASIRPDGPASRLGLRIGDVPFEYHGQGMSDMYFALDEGLKGRSATFKVINVKDGSHREISVTPELVLPKVGV